MWLGFSKNRSAIVQSSWLDPRKIREMTIVGSRRMIVYDDTAPLEKIRVFDARVESPPHYDTFAEFHYAYHYGDQYIPYVKQEEPLKVECQHFIDCVRYNHRPVSDGQQALNLVRILEASSRSLELNGARIDLADFGAAASSSTATTASSNGSSNANGNGNHVSQAEASTGNGHSPKAAVADLPKNPATPTKRRPRKSAAAIRKVRSSALSA
jgi:hypothetical protein